jgi:hypothetical protein
MSGIKYKRKRLWEAQDRRCFYCRCKLEEREATADHVRAIHRQGKTCWENLVVACEGCNTTKGHQEPDWLLQRLGILIPFVAYREMTLAPILITRGKERVNVGGNRAAILTRKVKTSVAPVVLEAQGTKFAPKRVLQEIVRQKARKLALERAQEAVAEKAKGTP